MMANIFEQINQLFKDAEWTGILVIILVISLIVMNVTICICVISMRKSLKKISRKDCCCEKGCCCKKDCCCKSHCEKSAETPTGKNGTEKK